MARTFSTMLPLGTVLPQFELAVVKSTNLLGDPQLRGLDSINSKMLVEKPILLMIICAHCPFVKHIEVELTRLDKDYGDQVHIFAIASNSLITHPQDGPENLAVQSQQQGWRFPYLLDLDQSLAKALHAACTPDFFLFSPYENGVQNLMYRGQLDSSRPGGNIPVNGEDLRAALTAVLAGAEVSLDQRPSIGCNIKWDPGHEPLWFS